MFNAKRSLCGNVIVGIVLVGMLVLVEGAQGAEILAADGSSIQDGGSDTTSSGWSDVGDMSVSLNLSAAETGKVLVISTFSADSATAAVSGSWRLNDGTTTSVPISRYISNAADQGIGMTINLFSAVTGTNTYTLQHSRTSALGTVSTNHGNITAISLKSDNGAALSSNQITKDTEFLTTNTSFVPVTGTTQSIDLTGKGGHVYLSAAFDSKSSAADTGKWKMQLDTTGGGNWTTVGTVAERYMSGSTDTGAVMLTGIYDSADLASGSYNYRLMASSTSGNDIITNNLTMTAVGLSFSAEEFLPHAQNSFSGSSDTNSVTLEKLELPAGGDFSASMDTDASGDVFVGASFSVHATNSQADTLSALSVENDQAVEVMESGQLERGIWNSSDVGSAGLSALSDSPLASDAYHAYILFADASANPSTISSIQDPSLVMIGLTSIPEPATMSLLALGGIGLLAKRRRRKA
jgi:hypothetical protein